MLGSSELVGCKPLNILIVVCSVVVVLVIKGENLIWSRASDRGSLGMS